MQNRQFHSNLGKFSQQIFSVGILLFRHLDAQFNEDAETLATSIRNLKAQSAACNQELEVEVTPVIQPPESNLASRAKDLRGMTERRFAEVIDGWRRQNDALQQELDMYQNQQRISSER